MQYVKWVFGKILEVFPDMSNQPRFQDLYPGLRAGIGRGNEVDELYNYALPHREGFYNRSGHK